MVFERESQQGVTRTKDSRHALRNWVSIQSFLFFAEGGSQYEIDL